MTPEADTAEPFNPEEYGDRCKREEREAWTAFRRWAYTSLTIALFMIIGGLILLSRLTGG